MKTPPRALDLLMQLLSLPGPSGGEKSVADFITGKLLEFGLPENAIASDRAFRHSPLVGTATGNLAVRLPGTIRGPRRLFVAHMDTVPLCRGASPVRKGRRIVSTPAEAALGGDNRTGCAVLLATALELLKHQSPHPPLTFLWTVQEEFGLRGVRHLSVPMLRRPKLAFNFDGGPANRLTLGATGGYRMHLIVHGVASHAGMRPERGVSATAIAALAIADLVERGWHGLVTKGSHRGTSNVGVIAGGSATNVVTDRVALDIEARSHDPKFRRRIIKEIEQAFQKAAARLKNDEGASGRVEITGHLDYESFRLKSNEPSVVEAAHALTAEGLEVDYAIANGGLDANWLVAHGIPTVTLGCGQNAIHTAAEWVDIDEFEKGCRVARRLAVSAS